MKTGLMISGVVLLVTSASAFAESSARIEIRDLSSDDCQQAGARIVARLEAVEQHIAGFNRSMVDSTLSSEHSDHDRSRCWVDLTSQNPNIGFSWKETPKVKRATATTDDTCVPVEEEVLLDSSNLFTERNHKSSGILLPPSKCWVKYLQVGTLQ